MSGFSNAQARGRPIDVKDEGVTIASNIGSIDFAGAGIAGSALGSAVTETVPGGVGVPVVSEIPSGTINGVNVTFTLAHAPVTGTLRLFLNGARLKSTDDYSLAGSTITMGFAPPSSSNFLADYEY